MRTSRLITYSAGWAVLTVLAAFAVWWGLRPLLSPGYTAAPPTPSPSPSVSPSRVPSPTPSPSSPKPKPSLYDGWAFINGSFTRTFDVTGGSATVRIKDRKVELVSSTPRDGYTITSRQPDPQRLVLEFFKPGGHFTVVDAMWWEERPYAQVTNVG